MLQLALVDLPDASVAIIPLLDKRDNPQIVPQIRGPRSGISRARQGIRPR